MPKKYVWRDPRRPKDYPKPRKRGGYARIRRRRSYYLNYVPKPGSYCIMSPEPTRSMDRKPLACFDNFMDALHEEDLPDNQGVTRKGMPRDVVCYAKTVMSGDVAGKTRGGRKRQISAHGQRPDGLEIWEVSRCVNRTKAMGWDPDTGTKRLMPTDALDGLGRHSWVDTPQRPVGRYMYAGVALFLLAALASKE